jgi:hypothetical protein
VVKQSKARVCGHSLARIAGSNPAGDMDVSLSSEYCVLSGEGLCDEPITHPEEFYRLCRVIVCDVETSRMRRPWPALGCWVRKKIKRLCLGYNTLTRDVIHVPHVR